jgi:hypothetical protein
MTLASYTNETEMESGNYYYYDSSSGEYKKAYTINQIKGLEDKNYYYQGNTTYTEDSLEEKTTFNNIPILLKTRSYKVNSDGSITITGETINSSNNYTFKFTNSSTIQIADTSCDIKYTGTVTLSVSSISLTQMTNGTF